MAADKQLGYFFLIKWIWNNEIALAVGLFLSIVFRMTSRFGMESSHVVSVGDILGGISIGIVVGFLQSTQLKPWLTRKLWWTIASILGWPLAMIWFGNPIQEINLLILFKYLLPIILGIIQWFVLRRLIRRAGWWVLLSYFGLILSFFVLDYLSGIFANATNTIYPFVIFIPIVLFPIPYSMITGTGLLWMIGGRQEITKLAKFPKAVLKDDGE